MTTPDTLLLPSGAGAPLGLAEALFLVSPWKPLLILVPLLGWAWVVSSIYDKDAQRFYLKRKAWNLGHIVAGLVALGAAVLSPTILIGLPAMLLILGIDLGVYFAMRNKDDRVPEGQRWSLNPSEMLAAKKSDKADKARARDVTLVFRTKQGVIPPPERETPEFAIRARAEGVITDAMDSRATRFEIIPANEQAYAAFSYVDGVRSQPEAIPAAEAVAVIDFLKKAAGLDTSERRKRQVGDVNFERLSVKQKLRVTTQGVQGGMRLFALLNPETQVARTVEDLGLVTAQQEELKRITSERGGVVLLGAPPMGGRTSLMYAVVRAHDAYTTNVQTMEMEQLSAVEGVRHNVFDPTVDGAEYSTTVRSILRRDPDVVAIAETPDTQTALEVAKADHSRTRIYLALRADTALGALQAYTKAVGDAALAAKGLRGVVVGRLARRLCPNCKAAYQPTPDMLKKIGLPPDKVQTLYRKGGQVLIKNKPETCPMCGGTGHLGQEGLFEVHSIGDEERSLIAKGDWAALRAAMRKRRLPGLQEAALRKAAEGTLSVEEIIRVLAPPAQAKAGQPAAAGS